MTLELVERNDNTLVFSYAFANGTRVLMTAMNGNHVKVLDKLYSEPYNNDGMVQLFDCFGIDMIIGVGRKTVTIAKYNTSQVSKTKKQKLYEFNISFDEAKQFAFDCHDSFVRTSFY